jgi:hypothetical protein
MDLIQIQVLSNKFLCLLNLFQKVLQEKDDGIRPAQVLPLLQSLFEAYLDRMVFDFMRGPLSQSDLPICDVGCGEEMQGTLDGKIQFHSSFLSS